VTRVLVLGANGFVGRRVVAALTAAAWATPVAGSFRAVPSLPLAASPPVARVTVDATDRAALAAAVEGVDAIVNCIAGDPGTIDRNAAALAAVAGDRRIVHLSSMAVYGSATGLLDETAPLRGDTGAYAAAKVAAEQTLIASTDVVILRPGCIYGAGSPQWTTRIATLLAQRRIGDLGAGGDGCSNIVHVDDVAAAVLLALRSDHRGAAFNLAMPDAPDWNGYFLALARACGAVPIRRIPAWQLKLEKAAAIPLKLAEQVTRALPPPIPPSLLRFWAQNVTLDSTAATDRLGVRWTPLAAGLADLCRGSGGDGHAI